MQDEKQVQEIRNFLARFDLTFDSNVEYTICQRLDGVIVGTGSFAGEVLRNIAVDESVQGCGHTSAILSELMREQAQRGRLHYFVFTKPSNVHLFSGLGFKEIARAEPYAALLETGIGSIDSYCAAIEQQLAHLPGKRAAVVVNCNPFTKGHRALIKKASSENDAVVVFVVSEDRSLFPFEVRYQLVQLGVADLPNVIVVPAGKYIISSATFPTYFTREEDTVSAQTRLDISLFATQIARKLRITARYVGLEPYCSVTSAYNQAMLEILPQHGVNVQAIDRIEVDGEPVSASKVRDMIRHDDWSGIQKLVPDSTYQYLLSAEAQPILDKIRCTNCRH